jgi:hypothetical protein
MFLQASHLRLNQRGESKMALIIHLGLAAILFAEAIMLCNPKDKRFAIAFSTLCFILLTFYLKEV